MRKLKIAISFLNIPRSIIVYMFFGSNPKNIMDLERYLLICKNSIPKFKTRFGAFNYLLTYWKEYRNVYLARIREKSYICYFVGRALYKPLANLYITNSSNISGGLFIQHGFSTIIAPMSIGKNCWINQQVTIGYSNDNDCPIIGDNVHISAGVIVIGNVHIGNNAIIGAGAVVVNDIPDNSVAVGVPARVIRTM